ncbi:DUF4407 domain-containing protein [Saccharothrix longispora]|uniref:DUF4407 domain-containing protein n=1 Tax=Saccharothrix longispora TaxID=33920 RepID=UPI0028FD7B93|nr:DUF4407 domain-containing protein [Saccharothrix longispora]MDU0293816.1 DUF4407 domain-containing protein [Saccharothrix longispora]
MAARVTTLLVRLSGADPKILRLVPEETPKFASMGGVILTTAVVTGVSMFVALAPVGVSPWIAAPAAAMWSALIATMDRWHVVSLQRQAKRLQTIVVIVPRLALALLLGVTTSTPLMLRIFEPEILAELAARGENADSGLLMRLEALSAIAARDISVNLAQYALLVLFASISVLPVLVRTLSLFAPPSRYDRATADEEARLRAEVLRKVAQTHAEMMGAERELADRLAEMLTKLGPPVEGRSGGSGDELNGGRS